MCDETAIQFFLTVTNFLIILKTLKKITTAKLSSYLSLPQIKFQILTQSGKSLFCDAISLYKKIVLFFKLLFCYGFDRS